MKVAFLIGFLLVLVLQWSDAVEGSVLPRLNRAAQAASPVVHNMHHAVDVNAVKGDVQSAGVDIVNVETASGSQGVDDDEDSEDDLVD